MSNAYPIKVTTETSSLQINSLSNCNGMNEVSLDLKKDEPFAHLMASLGTCIEMNASSVAADTGFEVLSMKLVMTPKVENNELVSIHIDATYETSPYVTMADAEKFFEAVEDRCFMSQFLLDANMKITHSITLSLDPVA